MHPWMYACMYVCTYVCMYVWTYVCTYVCMYACMYVCMHACMYVCMHACMHHVSMMTGVPKTTFPWKKPGEPSPKTKNKTRLCKGGNRTGPLIHGHHETPKIQQQKCHISTSPLLTPCVPACFEQLREQARRPSPMHLCPSPYLQPPPTILQENRPPSPPSPGCAIAAMGTPHKKENKV